MKIPEKTSKKKRQLIKKSKWKLYINKPNLKTIIISILGNSGKKILPISTLKTKVSIPITKFVDIAMIGSNTYCIVCRLKKARVFAISMRNLRYQVEKEVIPETDPKTIVSTKYHDFLDRKSVV